MVKRGLFFFLFIVAAITWRKIGLSILEQPKIRHSPKWVVDLPIKFGQLSLDYARSS